MYSTSYLSLLRHTAGAKMLMHYLCLRDHLHNSNSHQKTLVKLPIYIANYTAVMITPHVTNQSDVKQLAEGQR